MKKTTIALAMLLAIFLQNTTSTAQTMNTKQTLTPELLWSIGRLGLQTVSPDGQWVVYGVSHYDVASNGSTKRLYAMHLADRRVQLLDIGAYGAQFRPDGKVVGYLKEGKLHEIGLDGTAPHKVSEEEMDGFKYSPTGDRIVFSRMVQYEKVTGFHNDLPESTGRLYDGLLVRHWTAWSDGKYSNLFVADYTNGALTSAPKNIMDEPYHAPIPPYGGMEQVNFSSDGRFVAYASRKLKPTEAAQSTNSDIYLYELKSGNTINVSLGLEGYDLNPIFSADGKYMAWTSMEKAGYEADRTRIMLFNTATNERTEPTRNWDYEAVNPTFSKDGNSFFFTSATDFTYQLYKMPLRGGTPVALTAGIHDIHGFAEVADGKIVLEHQSMSEPTELYQVDSRTLALDRLTYVTQNPWDDIQTGDVERTTIKTFDNKDMNVWVIYPPDFDPKKKYPALLYCQGGPQGALSQFFSYRWNFQMMASQGSIAIAPCRRGMPGSGSEWNEIISKDWGGGAMKDYLAATDELKKRSYIDENRLGAVGASYGGYSVYWLAGNHEKRFKTFISHCGLFNLESFYGATEELWFANWDLDGPYWEAKDTEKWLRHSPHRFVKNWDTPILVIHNELDFRVPLGEGLQAYTAAQVQGIPSKLLYFSDEGHHVYKPQNGIFWQREFFKWLEEYLK